MQVYAHTTNNQPIIVVAKKQGRVVGVLLATVITNGNVLTKHLTARSIIIGGPIVANDNPEITRLLIEEYKRRLPYYVIYTEIRPVYNMDGLANILQANGFVRKGHYNILLRINRSKKELWEGLHKERRRNIGQAQKAGLRFREVRKEKERRNVIQLLEQTYHRKHVPFTGSSLFEHLPDIMPENVHFFAAYYNGKMIAGQIRLGYKELLYAWYAGSDESYFKLRPNDFLMWNVICWGQRHGYNVFDFGGGGEPGVAYGVREYKLKYGCEIYDYGRYVYAHRPLMYKLGTQAYKMYHKIKDK